jgi:Skp family chaperone for outer membrane proteins
MNTSKKALSLLLTSAAFVTVITHAAVQSNVGFVSATEIMMGTEQGKNANKRIEDERERSSKILQTRAQAIEKKQKDLEAKASTISRETQQKLSLEIASLRQELELDNKKFMQELQLSAQSEMEKLGAEFDKAVQRVAKEGNFDAIYELESGRPVFVADHLKKTDLVKTAMNSDFKATQVASAKKDAAPAKATA